MNTHEQKLSITVRSSPSLALIKYWGKIDSQENIPATSSLALNLEGLHTETRISLSKTHDAVKINGFPASIERFTPFFNNIRKKLKTNLYFNAESKSNFPTGAGLASSSSGFSALAYGCARLIDSDTPLSLISDLARLGSASAARAVYGGYTTLERGARNAAQLCDPAHWPELKVIVAIVKNAPKKVSSRNAMENCKATSPYYQSWLLQSEDIFQKAIKACKDKDLTTLGPLIRQSYLMMFSTMFTSIPPVFYWESDSIRLIKTCETLRNQGFPVWETMDAGPQVKIITLEEDCQAILSHLKNKFPKLEFLTSQAGNGPEIINPLDA